MDQHAGVDFENDDPTAQIQRAINAEVIEVDFSLDRPQRMVLRGAEDAVGILEESSFLVLHPVLIDHVRVGVVNLPFVMDCKVIGINPVVDEHKTILSKETIGRAVIEKLCQVKVSIWKLSDEGTDFVFVMNLLEVIAIVRACQPD